MSGYLQTTRQRLLIATAALFLLTGMQAHAMRCGNRIISKGDTQAKVLKYCGQPVQAKDRLGLRSGVYLGSGDRDAASDLLYSRGHFIPYGRREVLVEEWVFNFGPRKLMRQVTFENGVVEQVRELGYGYRE